MIDQYNALIRCRLLREQIAAALAVLGEHGHATNYLGLNYSETGLESVKFYFLTTAKIDLSDIALFFPHSSAIEDKYKEHKGSEKFDMENLGVTFSIKIDKSGNISHAYYQQCVGQKNVFPSKIRLPVPEKSIRDDFYVREFREGKITEKIYFFMSNRENLSWTMDQFHVCGIDKNQVRHIEYAEFSGQQKMVMVIPDLLSRKKYIRENNSKEELSLIDHLTETHAWVPEFPGKYLSGSTKAIYFFGDSGESGFFSRAKTLNKAFS